MLLLLAIQDWKDREVNWYWFPLLVVAALGRAYFMDIDFLAVLVQMSMSLSFVLFNTVVLFVYLYLRYGKTAILSGNLIGSGDLLFFLVLVCFGSFLHYLLFFTVSLAISLLLWISLRRYSRYDTVPLAGLQSVCLALAWLWGSFSKYDTYNDEGIIALLFA